MDVSLLLQHSQYGIPVGIVLLCAILVFVFGFKKAEQPPFAQLSVGSDVDRKLASKKRSKTREKKAANGQVVTEKASPAKKAISVKAESAKKSSTKTEKVDDGKLKERKQEDNKPAVKKEKNQEAKSGKENKVEQVKNKKNQKNLLQEKPVDFDEGDWEPAYSRKDKKNKKKEEDTPSKKSKKTAKKTDLITEVAVKDKDNDQEKTEIKDKVAKETENKELKEKDNKEVVLTPIINDNVEEEKVVEKKSKVSNKVEKSEKEEKKPKSKKSKKISESDNAPPAQKPEPKLIEELVEKKMEEVIVKDVSEPIKIEQGVEKAAPAFDELGDVWTEAKPQKKSKKKARRDN